MFRTPSIKPQQLFLQAFDFGFLAPTIQLLYFQLYHVDSLPRKSQLFTMPHSRFFERTSHSLTVLSFTKAHIMSPQQRRSS
jgi:hypothetical protein